MIFYAYSFRFRFWAERYERYWFYNDVFFFLCLSLPFRYIINVFRTIIWFTIFMRTRRFSFEKSKLVSPQNTLNVVKILKIFDWIRYLTLKNSKNSKCYIYTQFKFKNRTSVLKKWLGIICCIKLRNIVWPINCYLYIITMLNDFHDILRSQQS